MNTIARSPLSDTLWRLGAVLPLFGGAEAEDQKDRHPAAAVMLRRLQQESQDAIKAQFAMSRSAMDHAVHAAHRLSTARDPMDAAVAQTAFTLALAELAAAPVRAWLDALPKLHECCVAFANDPQPPNFTAQGVPPATGTEVQRSTTNH